MKGYVVSVIGIVIVSAVLSCIIPEGKTSSMIKGIAKTACVAVIVAPILQFFQSGEIPTFMYENAQENFLQSGIETDVGFIQYYSEKQVKNVEEDLQTDILQKYAVDTSVLVEWTWAEKDNFAYKTNEIMITKIKVFGMEKQSEEMKKQVKEYLSKNYCNEVQIE